MVMKNSGLRPNSELNKLRWCDVKRENVGRWSDNEESFKEKCIANIYIKESKTGRQRVVPTNGVDQQLQAWRKEQQDYIDNPSGEPGSLYPHPQGKRKKKINKFPRLHPAHKSFLKMTKDDL